MNGKMTPILVVLLIIASFAIGSMWTRIQFLQSSPNPSTTLGTATQPTPATPQQPPVPQVTLDKIKALFADGFIHFGDANKKILFVEVSDPSCPFCHFAGGKDPELVEEFAKQNAAMSRFKPVAVGGTYNSPVEEMRKLVNSGQASFMYVYYPGHGNGELATQALYCAFEKGAFWEVHDILMSYKGYKAMNTDKANTSALANLLSPAIDKNFLQACLSSGKYADKLNRDQQLTTSSLGWDPKNDGTPHFLVNTTVIGGAQDYKSAFEPLVKILL